MPTVMLYLSTVGILSRQIIFPCHDRIIRMLYPSGIYQPSHFIKLNQLSLNLSTQSIRNRAC